LYEIMKHVFGPVPSRRLGQSLGIDPIPLKTCNWNCVYCQLGRTRPLTNARCEYIPRQDILVEVQQALAAHRPGEIDWVTFVGSGEPTLHSGLGWLIRQVKSLTDLPVAVITNGALLCLPDVRAELTAANAVLPSLDAGSKTLYRKINRPWPGLTFETHLQGLIAFRQEHRHALWVEIMLIKDLNDTEQALQDLAAALKLIRPDRVDLMLPERPPAESWVHPTDASGLLRAQNILSKVAPVAHPEARTSEAYEPGDLESAVLGIITRHPMQIEELLAALGNWSADDIQRTLEKLEEKGQAQQVIRHAKRFWTSAAAFYDKIGGSYEP
jgi:wyosine [tRNA(Phe)-imidazoG37] synthetase (radical SAM superfamily)